jgi:hypothetical protein
MNRSRELDATRVTSALEQPKMNYSKRFFNITRSRCEFQQGGKENQPFSKNELFISRTFKQ